jgi:uncharacterized protein YegP (UPF0339 family)
MGKFEIYKDKKGEYRFRLKAGNGEIIADSEGYKTKQGCMKGIISVQKNAVKAKIIFDDSISENTEYSFKKLKKELVRTDKEYANKNFVANKSKEELEDEKRTLSAPVRKLKRANTYWM